MAQQTQGWVKTETSKSRESQRAICSAKNKAAKSWAPHVLYRSAF